MLNTHEAQLLARHRQAELRQEAELSRRLHAAGVDEPVLGLPSATSLVEHLLRAQRWWSERRAARVEPAAPRARVRAARS